MNNPLINPGLGTIVWMLVSFGILAFILIKFGWPMILKSLKKREEAIARSLNEAAVAHRTPSEFREVEITQRACVLFVTCRPP